MNEGFRELENACKRSPIGGMADCGLCAVVRGILDRIPSDHFAEIGRIDTFDPTRGTCVRVVSIRASYLAEYADRGNVP
jgi:hypothetical protein